MYLFFQGLDPAVPELTEVQAGIEYARRIDLQGIAVKAERQWFVVATTKVQVMAAGTGQTVVNRQARVVEQLASQFDPFTV
ncbi:hypothetical protein D3C85_1622930 [compost metagenome]